MATVTISEHKLQKVLQDVEVLIEDVASLINQDKIARQRLAEIKANPLIGKSEKDLDDYLTKRGIKIA